jgi:hypothetical protein
MVIPTLLLFADGVNDGLRILLDHLQEYPCGPSG